ncbi:hypothetical protein RRG08_017579 [Elysia crispata]|uniref:Uncharacterized protein n=1 Tax=Elysia crispata TaxID=231223 RepID=A0AAE0YDG2_9GAST|nr:hypothetical protein RRG08_017579 [Elysia crispata]
MVLRSLTQQCLIITRTRFSAIHQPPGVYFDHPQILSLPTPAPRRAESLVPSPLHYGLLLGVKLQLWAMTVKTTQSTEPTFGESEEMNLAWFKTLVLGFTKEQSRTHGTWSVTYFVSVKTFPRTVLRRNRKQIWERD